MQLEAPLRIASAWASWLVLFLSSVLVNAVQVLATAGMWLLQYDECTRLAVRQSLANTWWCIFCYILELWGGVKYVITGDTMSRENAILIGNHTSTLDFTNGVVLTTKVDGLGCGRMMTMMKQSLQLLPTVGWMHTLQGSLFLKRNWEVDHKALDQKLKDMATGTFPRPFWIGVYPEGTRITPSKKEASHKFAEKRGLPKLNHVLLPRTKGFVFLKERLPNCVDCVYDTTIAYENDVPVALQDSLKTGRFRATVVHIHVKRIPCAELPEDSKGLEQWLLDRFVEKDRMLEEFKTKRHFPGTEIQYRSKTHEQRAAFVAWAAALNAVLYWTSGSGLAVGILGALQLVSLVFSFTTSQAKYKPN